MTDDAELRVAWSEAVGTSPEAWEAFDDVVGRHRAPHRQYHGVRHVTWTVRHVRELAAIVPVNDEAAVIAAAFFHDAVYDVDADDNEARSAALAERVLGGLGWSADRCSHVARARAERRRATNRPRMPTRRSCSMPTSQCSAATLPPTRPTSPACGPSTAQLDDEQWRTGRGAVLRRLLDRQPMYSTEAGRSRWERRARANMAAELASLEPREQPGQ